MQTKEIGFAVEKMCINLYSERLQLLFKKVKQTGKPEIYTFFSQSLNMDVETHFIYKDKVSGAIVILDLLNSYENEIEF